MSVELSADPSRATKSQRRDSASTKARDVQELGDEFATDTGAENGLDFRDRVRTSGAPAGPGTRS